MLNDFEKQDLSLLTGQLPPPVTEVPGSQLARWSLAGRMSPDQPVRQIPILPSPFSIGRRTSVNLCLPDMAVSGVHAELVDLGDSLVLHDLGSKNGTYVNGQRVAEPVELDSDDLVQFGGIAFRVQRRATPDNRLTVYKDVTDEAMVLARFDQLMSEKTVIPHFQPIVELGNGKEGQIVAFEVLSRSNTIGLETPEQMFSMAALLSLEAPLSRMIRCKAVEQTMTLPTPPHLFLNTHPEELRQPGLIESMQSLRKINATQQITLEIHEKAVVDTDSLGELRAALRHLNIGLAFDDFGSGQTRFAELSKTHPDYLKFDASLIRSIDQASDEHRQMIGTLVQMVLAMGVTPLTECVETKAECDVCTQLGFELGQGFYFGQPEPLSAISDS